MLGGGLGISVDYVIGIQSINYRYVLVSKLGTIEGYSVGILECVAADMVEIMEDCGILGILGGM